VAELLTVCEIFSHIEVENRHFCALYSDCRPLAEESPPNMETFTPRLWLYPFYSRNEVWIGHFKDHGHDCAGRLSVPWCWKL